jgi:hypothetical protein
METSSGLFSLDGEGGPSTLLWRSVMPTRRKYERTKSQNQRPILWPDIPGSNVLWDVLTEDEMRYLKFTLNCQRWFTRDDMKSDGFAAYSASIVAMLGEVI